jgi:heat shock protein HslJ
MAFVADLNFNDQNMTAPPELPPGWPFAKGWRIRNSGTCPWDNTYRLVYVTGNTPAAQMGGQPTAVQGTVAAGQSYDMFVNLVAPAQPGTYQGFWQMVNGRNTPFGQRVWVGITVPAPATATPVPTQTPAPNMQFSVNTSNITQGQCVQFTWNVTGASQVFFYRSGAPYQQSPAPATGSSQECPQSTTTFELRANWPDGTFTVRQLTITVTPAPQAPRIDRFTVEPAQIFTGGCVVLNWVVSGSVTQVDISRNGSPIWTQAPLNGQRQDCPPGTGGVAYNLVASGPGGNNQAQQNITIVQPTAVPPTATPTAPVPPPVINSFAVTPQQITAGDCVLISWSVGGGSVRTQVQRNGQVILDNAQHSGSLQDCPDTPGTVAYRLQTWNNNDQSTVADQTVTVAAAPTGPTLTNTNWNLVSYWNGTAEITALPGTTTWILFNDNGTFSGNAGCNNYNGSYQVNGTGLQVTGPIVSTGIVCGEPAGLMEQESQYLANLEAVRQFAINNNELQLLDGNGRVVLRYGLVTITPFGGQ